MTLAYMPAAMARDPLESALDHHRRGDLASAEAAYAAILAANPLHPGALMGLGLIAHAHQQTDRAIALLEAAQRMAPRDPAVLNNLGLALDAGGKVEEAQALWRRALMIAPGFADALVNLATADMRVGREDSAIGRLRLAASADARCVPAHANLGSLLLRRRAYSEAVACLKQAVALDPGHVDAWVNLGRAFSECGLAIEARDALQKAYRCRPQDRAAASNLLLCLHYCDDLDAATVAKAHLDWGRRWGSTARVPTATTGKAAGSVLHVGLLSADFNDHAVMRFLLPVLRHSDAARIRFTAFYTGEREDSLTAEARKAVGEFRAVGKLDDDELTARLRESNLDALVDLSGHSGGGRVACLAARPAPVQVSWLGYLGTTGLPAIDFRLTDAVADPPGMTEGHHAERLWRLPVMWCYEPRPEAPDAAPAPAIPNGHVTFGSTNNPAKLSEATLSLWADVLRAVPRSRMSLHAHDDSLCRDRIVKAFGRFGVDREHLEFFPREDAAAYLTRYASIDILLDTTPFNGGTTTCDALWMGVPVVSLAGDRPFSRTGASVLRAAGFPQWAVSDKVAFVQAAVALASDIPVLAAVREQLRSRVAASLLCDGPAMAESFTRALEAMLADASGFPRGDA